MDPTFSQKFGLDPENYKLVGDKLQKDALILLVGSEYTSVPWDNRWFPFWGWFVVHAWVDTVTSKAFE